MINDSEHVLSYSEIKGEIGKVCSRVTLYRVLERLEQEGVMYKIADVDGTFRFGSQSPKDNNTSYVHFSCVACRNVTKLKEDHVTFSSLSKHQVHFSQITMAGICPQFKKSTQT